MPHPNSSLESFARAGKIALLSLVGIVMVAISMIAFNNGIRFAWADEDTDCPGDTACPTDCRVWCQGSCSTCTADCGSQTVCPNLNCSQVNNPCCGVNDNCETFPGDCCADHVNCDDAPVALTFINDNANYRGYPTGLYTDRLAGTVVRTNTIPDTHLKAARYENGSKIVPRNSSGNVDWANGYIGILSIGFSNPNLEFASFINNYVLDGLGGGFDDLMNSRLAFVNGAEGGAAACDWRAGKQPSEALNVWELILGEGAQSDPKLNHGRTPGGTTDVTVDVDQIQVVWMKMVFGGPLSKYCPNVADCDGNCNSALCGDQGDNANDNQGCQFPNWVYNSTDGEAAAVAEVLAHIREYFPNVKQVFITSRGYGGYGNGCGSGSCHDGSPEPWAYTNGFTVQELMRRQIYAGELDFGPLDDYPLILWGPYLWANGEMPNDTVLGYEQGLGALSYHCWHWCANGGHPSTDADACAQISGRKLISERMYNFFKNDNVATDWFRPRPARKQSSPGYGTIDRLQDFDETISNTPQGTTQVVFEFTHEVREAGSSDSSCDGNTDCFTVDSTCSDPDPACLNDVLPTIQSVVKDSTNPKKYTVTLSARIVPGHWTSIIANVEMTVTPFDDIRVNPLDRVDLAFLPGDTTLDKVVNVQDYNRLESVLAGQGTPDVVIHDIDRDNDVDSADLTRLQQLLQGTNTTRQWNNYTLPDLP